MNNRTIAEGEKAALKAILQLALLGAVKALAGFLTGMTVIIADAVSTFADTLGVFASYFGLKLSRKSADKNFKYGYYKVETFAALLISIGIIYLGYAILRTSVIALKSPDEGKFRSFAITVTILAIAHSYRLYKALSAAAKKTNSLSLLASAKDKKMDMFAALAILISIIANYRHVPYVEGIVTTIIAFFILKVGIFSAKESLFFLLDYWDDPSLIKKINKVLTAEDDLVSKIKKLRLRRAGTYIFGEAFIEVNPYIGMQDLRDELEILQAKIEDLDPYIKSFSIYTHIPDSQKVKIAVPITGGRSLSAKVAENLKSTNAYLFVNISQGKVKDFYIKKINRSDKNPIELANFLKAENVQILLDNKLNSLLYFNLRRTHHILIYPNFSDIKTVKDTISLLLLDS